MGYVTKPESPTIRSYRELLGVNPVSTADELKKAYHRLALLYHPDRNPAASAVQEFQKIRQAYEVLCDPLQVHALNRAHTREKLFSIVVDGLNVCFGSFFGYRVFSGNRDRMDRTFRIGKEMPDESDCDPFETLGGPIEQSTSILDNAAYDSLEIVYAGKFNLNDEEHLQEGLKGSHIVNLPWVVINNQGILHFLAGDIKKARRCYEALNERVPNNIIFIYRLGLCHIIEAFQNPERNFIGFGRPDRKNIERGLSLFKRCIHLGSTRKIGKQKCLVIRKIYADVLDRTGRKRAAQEIWNGILADDPSSVEATLNTKGLRAAQALFKQKNQKVERSQIRQLSKGKES